MNYIKEQLKKITPLRIAVQKVKKRINPSKNSYAELRKKLEHKDRENVNLRPELLILHDKLNKLKNEQKAKWNSFVYCDGYFYQGYDRIGISGIKPTESRFSNYEIEKYLDKSKTVLDIGANSGFLACFLSKFVKNVDGIELNPYLVCMGKTTAEFLELNNVNFILGDFIKYNYVKKYDIIFSLSNHYTIDGNLNIDFDYFIAKIFNNLKSGGILFFESHNLNGDDKDITEKFKIASKYFELKNYKMVKAFYPQDIDKLFAIFMKVDEIREPQTLNFKLEDAKNKYKY